MARLEPLTRDEVPQYDQLLAMTEAFMGVVPNSLLTMARQPRIFEPFMAWASAVLNPLAIDAGLGQLIAYVSSVASGCRYCQAHTSSHAAHVGTDVEKIAHAFEFETSPLFSEADRAALRVARAAGVSPNEVTDEMFEEMRRHHGDDACVEIVAIIAFFGHMNRWNDTMATTLEEGPRHFADRELDLAGWEIGRHG